MAKINKSVPSFAGYSFMKVATGSMTNESITINGVEYSSGHKVGDEIVIRRVNTDTLNVGDKIAFYVYMDSFNEYYENKPKYIQEQNETEYKISFGSFWGFQSKELRTASKANSKLVFHHIVGIYKEEDGTRWFKTQGSSATIQDYWVIKDSYVVGVYDSSHRGQVLTNIISFISSGMGSILLIAVPFILIFLLIMKEWVRNVALAKLELDCVEEKRKITDEICIKNNIGYRMDKKTKIKILVQADDEDKQLYIKLLWKDGSVPNSIRKYYLRKKLYLEPVKDLLEVNRNCEKMFREGKKDIEIARYYRQNKEKIEKRQENIANKLKLIKTKFMKGE